MDSPRKRQKRDTTKKCLPLFEWACENNGNQMYKCKVCKNDVNGNKKWNLAAHLEYHHSEEYNEAISDEKSDKSTDYIRLKLLLNLVELVTVNGRPFKCITDSAISSLLEEKLEKLKLAGKGVNLQDPHLKDVKEKLKQVAEKIRQKIRTETKNRALSLLVDIVTKHGRSILGVSIQYILNGKITTRSIGMIELQDRHTGIYLATVIKERLHELGIDLAQIISITTDNGSNVLKMIRDMESDLRKAIDDANSGQAQLIQTPVKSNSKNDCTETNEVVTDEQIEEALAQPETADDDELLRRIFGETDDSNEQILKDNHTLLTAITQTLNREHYLNVMWNITGVNCGAHTLQLMIKDGTKAMTQAHRNVIGLCRRIAILLRKNTTQDEMRKIGQDYKKPRIDVETRWCSEYLMVFLKNTFKLHFSIYSTYSLKKMLIDPNI